MTLVRFKKDGDLRPFNNFVNHFFTDFPSLYREGQAVAKGSVPVNIRETENGYLLEVVAPGWNKEDFRISLEQNLLTVSAEGKKEEEAREEQHLRREYRAQSFSRSFTLDEKSIEADRIEAAYVNGILKVSLPKKAEVKEPVKQIAIQ